MRKFFLTTFAVLVASLSAVAQDVRISGTVSDEFGDPVIGATILVMDSGYGVVTNGDGTYSISAPQTATLVYSFVGMATQSIEVASQDIVGSSANINCVLISESIGIADVVVTAMGITRSEKTLGYSVATVSAEDLSKAREGNLVNSLSGKVAGVNITQSSGTAGSSSKIIIRGQSSLGTSSQPIFVVDGMPVSNQSYNPTGINGSVDVGNRIGDIAGDDIESMSVLKGAAATALYGARAKDGAIIITTKRGRQGVTSISVNSSMRFENPLVLPTFQNEYAQGRVTDGTYDYGAQNGWGPSIASMAGQTVTNFLGEQTTLQAYPDNVKDFYETGVTYINSISVMGGDAKNDFRIGFSSHNQTGIIPNNDYDKYNFTFNGGRDFNEKLSARVSMSYVRSNSTGRPSQGSNDTNVIIPSINAMPRTVDSSWLKDSYMNEDGTQGTVDANGSVGNYYWNIYENVFTNELDRVYGSAIVTYKPIENLTITNNAGTDFYRETRRQIYAKGTVGAVNGKFTTYDIYQRSLNNDIMAAYDINIDSDWSIKLMAGHNVYQLENEYTSVAASDLLVANLYSYSNAESVVATNNMNKRRLMGVYGEASVAYKEIAYLSVTGRNDWSSTMPSSNSSYFYPSVSLGLVFTELFAPSPVLTFGKIRASYANVGSDTDPYMLDYLYYPESSIWMQYGLEGTFPHNGLLGFSATSTYPDPDLQPQNQAAVEFGVDLRFFNGRINLDATYYSNKTQNNIISLDVANSTGYFYKQTNAGVISNKGVEIMLSAIPVITRDFRWDLVFNFAKNRQIVESLADGVTSYTVDSGYNSCQVQAQVGESFGLYGTYWLTDDKGQYLISDAGTRIGSSTTKNLGNIDADYTLGINNSFTYKNFNISALVDIRKGGVMYSGTVQSLRVTGLAAETVGDNRANIVDEGVNYNTGAQNTVEVSPYTYWSTNYASTITEANVFDASYIKLREIIVSYTLPTRWFANSGIKSIAVGAEGRNLWLIDSEIPHIDPESNLFGPSSAGAGVEYNSIPTTRSFGFNIKLQF